MQGKKKMDFHKLPEILVLDDEPDIAELVALSVADSARNANPTVCTDPDEALKMLAEGKIKPDVIILDFKMPKKNGFQFVKALPPEVLPLQVILVSGAVDKNVAVEAVSLNIYAILEKPVNYDVLKMLIVSAYNYQKSIKLNKALSDETTHLNKLLSQALDDMQTHMETIENAWIEAQGTPVPGGDMTLQYLQQKKQQRLTFADIRNKLATIENLKKAGEN